MSTKITIKDLDDLDRPREKMISLGRQALSDAELLAILIGSGNSNETAVDLCRRILADNQNNLAELGKLSLGDLMKYRGIGEAKAITILASIELGRRRREAETIEKKQIKTSADAYEIFRTVLNDKPFEEFWIILVNRSNRVIRRHQVGEGGLTSSMADPRRIFKFAIDNLASGIILGHNHPSGNINPSESDIKLTKRLREGANLLDINILDHIIVGDDNYYSFADEGLIFQ